jgi:polyisoprenoid-binding protein YceI
MASVPQAGKFVLDPTKSSVSVHHKTMWGLMTVHGTFNRVSGEGELHEDGNAGGVITLDTVSLDTKNKKRDEHLRSADFFDTENHPSVQLEVVDVARRGDSVVDINGHLRVRGVSKPLSLTANIVGVDADGVTLSTEFSVDRDDYKMSWNRMNMMSGPTKVTATLRFTRRDS